MDNIKILKTAVDALESKKSADIKVLKIDKLTSLAEYFIICSGTSSTQIKALADIAEEKLKENGVQILHREGYNAGNWILLDYGNIVIHVFHKDTRDFYGLERLWADAQEIDINSL